MSHYNRINADDARAFNENLDAFFAGASLPPHPVIRDIGGADNVEYRTHDDLDPLAQLDALIADTRPPLTLITSTEAEEIRATAERVEVYSPMSAYDRWFVTLRAAEAERDAAEPDSAKYHAAMVRVAEAQRRFKIESGRGLDDGFRALRDIDDWRARGGREERNTGRRKVRAAPNERPRDMTHDDRAAHEAAQNRDRVWTHDKRKAGWTEDQIAAGLAKRHAKRQVGSRTCERFQFRNC